MVQTITKKGYHRSKLKKARTVRTILDGLRDNKTVAQISRETGFHQTTIARHIKDFKLRDRVAAEKAGSWVNKPKKIETKKDAWQSFSHAKVGFKFTDNTIEKLAWEGKTISSICNNDASLYSTYYGAINNNTIMNPNTAKRFADLAEMQMKDLFVYVGK